MSKQDLECKNALSARFRMSKKDFECQNSIFGQSSNLYNRFLNVETGFRMSKSDIQPEFEFEIWF